MARRVCSGHGLFLPGVEPQRLPLHLRKVYMGFNQRVIQIEQNRVTLQQQANRLFYRFDVRIPSFVLLLPLRQRGRQDIPQLAQSLAERGLIFC